MCADAGSRVSGTAVRKDYSMSVHLIVNVLGAVTQVAAAAFWFLSARIKVPDNQDTFIGELQRIGYWNGWAATASCVAAIFVCLSLIVAR